MPPGRKFITFLRGTPLTEVVPAVSDADQPVFPVLNADSSLYGIIDLDDIRMLLGTHALSPGLVVAEDLCFRDFRATSPDESLAAALRKLRQTKFEAIPVVEIGNSHILHGIISRRNISNAYHDYLYRDGAR